MIKRSAWIGSARIIVLIALLTSATLAGLVACGGGGSSSGSAATTEPAAPGLLVTFRSAKTLVFSWTDVTGETEYRLLEDKSGTGSFDTVATLAADATRHELVVPLALRLNARYVLQACNVSGCASSAPFAMSTQLNAAIGYVKATNPGLGDGFGNALALSADGATLAVGAVGEDSGSQGVNPTPDETSSGTGAVYVYVRNGADWSLQAFIKAVAPRAGIGFGNALALSSDGNTLVVGASSEAAVGPAANGMGNVLLGNAGAAYVFSRNAGSWSQQASLRSPNPGDADYFGFSVGISGDGNTVAVGARFEDSSTTGINSLADEAGANTGAVFVFVKSGTSWAQQAYIKASNNNMAAFFGESLALSDNGNTLVVGAPSEDGAGIGINSVANSGAPNAGAAYVFERNGITWVQQAYLKASNTGADDNFGTSVSLSADGNTLAVGAPSEGTAAGGVNVASDEAARSSGAVYVFVRSNSNWAQQAFVKASIPRSGNLFGHVVSLSADGTTLAVGAPLEGGNGLGLGAVDNEFNSPTGAAYLLTRSGVNWTQRAYIKATSPSANDDFGFALAVSGDGLSLAVGARNEDGSGAGFGAASNDNLMNSGAVYLY